MLENYNYVQYYNLKFSQCTFCSIQKNFYNMVSYNNISISQWYYIDVLAISLNFTAEFKKKLRTLMKTLISAKYCYNRNISERFGYLNFWDKERTVLIDLINKYVHSNSGRIIGIYVISNILRNIFIRHMQTFIYGPRTPKANYPDQLKQLFVKFHPTSIYIIPYWRCG